MIYVPDLENYKCFIVRDKDTIRAYKEIPTNNADIEYTDYYVNSHYLYNNGIQNFTLYSNLPTCIDNNKLTNSYVYRNDFDSIMIIFILFIGFIYFCLTKMFRTLFHGFRRY